MKKAIIVYGGWEGHAPQYGAELFGGLLEENGYAVTLSDSLDRFADKDALKAYDLIVPNWTMGDLSGDQSGSLLEAVAAGSGCAGWHGGMGDAFRKDCNFQFMVGGQFVAHPGNVKTYTVTIRDKEHPITRGLEDFEITSEQYYMHVDPSNTVLATTTVDTPPYNWAGQDCTWCIGTVMPVTWTRPFGQGRVAYSSLGHNKEDFDIPQVREMILRALKWATR